MEDHDGHAKIVERTKDGIWLTCLDCRETVGRLHICGKPTKKGEPCQFIVRSDLGHTICWSHGEGAGKKRVPKKEASNEATV